MRIMTAAALCISLTACATAEPFPHARPLTQSGVEALGPTRVSVTANETGVAKSWFYTQVNGGGAGLIGVVAGAIASVIINAAPSARAHRQATEVAEVVSVETLNQSLLNQIKAAAQAPSTPPAVSFPEQVLTQKILTPGTQDDAVEITTSYTLSEDSAVLKIVAQATYTNKAIAYRTPYTFKKSTPKSETTGPLYRNVFTYNSTPLPIPTLTPELKARLVTSIEETVRDETGAPPAEDSPEYKAIKREVELANDDKLTPTETSVFLTREWIKDDGALLKKEIETAHAFIAKYVLLDLNRTEVPSVTGTDELLETAADNRTVRRIGSGAQAGAYVSSPADAVSFATYGNTIAVGKATGEYIKTLRSQAKKEPAKKKAGS